MYASQPLNSIYRANSAVRRPFEGRDGLARYLGAGGGEPTVWDAVNYPAVGGLDFDDYWIRYQRQAIARALIDKPANATWQEAPDIVASEPETEGGESDNSTPFENDVEELMSGESLRRAPLHRFNAVHRLASLGEFAVLVFGFRDGRELSEPVMPEGEDDPTPPFDALDDLMYLAAFGQNRINDIDIETDMASPRFRQPREYELVVGTEEDDGETTEHLEQVHWTRVIHVPEGTLVDDNRGTPKFKPVFHNLINVEKILAGSAEGYWRGGYRGMVIRPPEAPGGGVANFDGSGASSDELADEIDQYTNNMQRTIATTGRVQQLDHSIADPAEHVDQQLQSIVAALDIPKSILVGQESADRATREDKTQWHETIAHIRNTWAGPVILRPFIERLVDVGILSEPPAGGFEIEWPELDEPSPQEQADYAKTLANALTKLSGGTPERLSTRAELRQVVGWDPELGSEAPDTFEDGDVSSDLAERMGPEVDEGALEGEDGGDGDE